MNKTKAKYRFKRVVNFILTPLFIAFQFGRAFERFHMITSGNWQRVAA